MGNKFRARFVSSMWLWCCGTRWMAGPSMSTPAIPWGELRGLDILNCMDGNQTDMKTRIIRPASTYFVAKPTKGEQLPGDYRDFNRWSKRVQWDELAWIRSKQIWSHALTKKTTSIHVAARTTKGKHLPKNPREPTDHRVLIRWFEKDLRSSSLHPLIGENLKISESRRRRRHPEISELRIREYLHVSYNSTSKNISYFLNVQQNLDRLKRRLLTPTSYICHQKWHSNRHYDILYLYIKLSLHTFIFIFHTLSYLYSIWMYLLYFLCLIFTE